MIAASRPRPEGRVRIIPSLLAADFGALRADYLKVSAGEPCWASVDVMDGHFVPNLSFGPDHVRALRGSGEGMLLDAHLMVSDPAAFGPVFAEAGADWVVFHLEACRRPRPLIKALRACGVGVGLALKPGTDAKAASPYLEELDLVLVMTVEPGFGGQGFLGGMLPKVRTLREEILRRGLKVWLQVDGGINERTAGKAAGAGADALVSGNGVFRAADPAHAMRGLRIEAQKAYDMHWGKRFETTERRAFGPR